MKANGICGVLQSHSILNYILHQQLQKKLASVAEQEFSSLIYTLLVAVIFFFMLTRDHQAEVSSNESGKSIQIEQFDKLYMLFRSEDMIL